MKTKPQFSKKANQQDDKQKLKLLLGEMHPSQVFKKYFLESLEPDPVEIQIDPPKQLFNDILEGKITFTFEVGMRLGRYYGWRAALSLVEYQKLYDDQMNQICQAMRAAKSKAFRREMAKFRRQGKQICAELRRQLRNNRRSKG